MKVRLTREGLQLALKFNCLPVVHNLLVAMSAGGGRGEISISQEQWQRLLDAKLAHPDGTIDNKYLYLAADEI